MQDHQNQPKNKSWIDIKYVFHVMNITCQNLNAEYVDVQLVKKANF